MSFIRFEKINKKFGTNHVLIDIDLEVEKGQLVTLLGPSGCGKSTLLRCLAGLEQVTSGHIYLDGQEITDVIPRRRGIGMVFQQYSLFPNMSVRDNVAYGLKLKKLPKAEINEKVEEMLNIVGLAEKINQYPAQLSGGQQQRVAIARTLAPSPQVLFMDEPLSNLDAKLRGEMRTELKRLHSDTNSTFVYVTHDQLEAMTLSTKVCLMETGVLQQYAPPLEIYNKPANTFVASFVGNPTMNFIPAQVEGIEVGRVTLSMLGRKAAFTAQGPIQNLGKQAIVGVRPEFLPIRADGALTAAIYSTLPAGMETTVKASCGDTMLTSVVFGSVDYPVDTQVRMDVVGDSIVLFDAESKKNVGVGKLEFA